MPQVSQNSATNGAHALDHGAPTAAGRPDVDDETLAAAVAVANIPTLLMVLVQMTGELHWLEAPYLPKRQPGLGDNDSGGLTPEHQQEVREAAFETVSAWRDGRPMAIPEPDDDLIVRMLSTAMGEHVPDEYGAFTAAQLGLAKFLDHDPISVPPGFKVLVIGAGASGLCAAINLQQAGVPFEVVERNGTVGGVWWENRYPGAGVDTPNHLYSYSFAPHDWKMYFCLREELHGYLEKVADDFDVRRSIRFNTSVESVSYDAERQVWRAEVRHVAHNEGRWETGSLGLSATPDETGLRRRDDGAATAPGANGHAQGVDGLTEIIEANVVISAAGIFNPPIRPNIDGLETWSGETWHTARWPADADLGGKSVAIVGNGASCMQTGPQIQDDVESLTIYQRSNHWAAPFDQFRKPVPDPMRVLFEAVPLYRAWYRVRLGWTFNDRIHSALQRDPDWDHPERSLNAQNDAHRKYFTRYVVDELGDRADELLDKVLPAYPPFGKRMLMDNGWYRMLRNPNVELVDDPIDEISGQTIRTADGSEREADVLVLATGFDVLRFITTYEAVGRSGRTLRESWGDDDASAYLGTVTPDFPNFFTLYGPNLQPGHGGSLIFVVEMQVRYIMDMIGKMCASNLGAVEVRPEVHTDYRNRVDEAHESMVWMHPGMTSYYRNESGRIVVNSPWRNVDYFDMTSEANLDDYVCEPRVADRELVAD
ncbi:flavin-containing monooxygenase [Candidatus Poriferisodalis sp.]|uniref:flavin-containing monooxygenase n=1 Tax=Candidatus Poriferisodalis sp. TaxID=3101277 RepID=UPI003D112215